jgi:hypothetical protein
MPSLMIRRVALAIMLVLCTVTPAAHAQEPPPRIPFIVVDLHGTFTRLPNDDLELATSRGISVSELPGPSFGADVALHVYPLAFRAITFGIGGQFIFTRGHQNPPETAAGAFLRPVTERFVSGAPQLSFNFGNGNGWSYVSGGLGRSVWQIIPDGDEPHVADEEQLKTINYGGGARWFIKKRLAFSFDVRFYAVNPGTPAFGFSGSPRTTFMVIGAGASLK